MKSLQSIIVSFGLALALIATASCAKHVGGSIDVPEIPISVKPGARSNLKISVAIEGVKDVRGSVVPVGGLEGESWTEPFGDVTAEVEKAIADAMTGRGYVVSATAPVSVWGEVRRWRSHVNTTTISEITSDAALYIEVLNAQGKRIFAGNYNGTRSSKFPITSQLDVKDSLGIAMAQAITQMLEDEEFVNSLWR